jgi:hypothetical protein
MPARKLDIELLERFYAQLRKQGSAGGKPMANSSVRQIHFILRAALGQAVKWGDLGWPCVRLAEGDLLIARNYVQPGSALVEKDTKTHRLDGSRWTS